MTRAMNGHRPATMLVTINVHGIGPEAATEPQSALYGRFAHGRYTYGGGLARVLDMLKRQEIAATFFWPVFEAERCPALLQRCLDEGHEVASHGDAFEDLSTLGDAERDVLEAARDRLAALCGGGAGARPAGFRASNGGFSPRTLEHLGALGYRYDSSAIDDDAPYNLAPDGGGAMIELPWSEGLCDATHFSRRVTQDRAYAHFLQEFDALIDVDGYACLTLHPRADKGVGRAARLVMVEEFLAHARERASVEFRRCRDVALSGDDAAMASAKR
jgi:peptidoglycan/xylan/chitin deacetylase (PgdA/CDA1 family)